MNILIDLEHTISNAWHRIDKKDSISSEAFHNGFIDDTLNKDISFLIESFRRKGHFVTILTGKTERFRNDIELWLNDYEVNYDKLVIKPENYDGTTLDFKEKYIKYSDEKYFMALTDVGKECEMFERYGIISYRITQQRD